MRAMYTSDPSDEAQADPAITCAACAACCCRLEVLLMGDDDIPPELASKDHWGGWVMRRLEDGWCAAVDRQNMRCLIYEQRPAVCREFEMGASDCQAERAKPALQPLRRRDSARAGRTALR